MTGSPPPPCQALPGLLVPLDQVAPDPDQPRVAYSEERLQNLADSIRAAGIIQALLVSPHPDPAARATTPYMLITGERRWLAARRAGLAAVPAVLRSEPLAPSDRLMLQLAENDPDLSEDLALFDLACAVARAFQLALCSQAQFARRHRRSQSWLSTMLHFAQSEGPMREALEEDRIQGFLAARALLRLPRASQRYLLADARYSGHPITLRRVEQYAARLAAQRRAEPAEPAATTEPPALAQPAVPALPAEPAHPTPSPPAARRTGLLRPHLARLVEAPPGPPIRLDLTPRQLATLLVLLGQEPAPSADGQVEQLLACL